MHACMHAWISNYTQTPYYFKIIFNSINNYVYTVNLTPIILITLNITNYQSYMPSYTQLHCTQTKTQNIFVDVFFLARRITPLELKLID